MDAKQTVFEMLNSKPDNLVTQQRLCPFLNFSKNKSWDGSVTGSECEYNAPALDYNSIIRVLSYTIERHFQHQYAAIN